MRVIGGEFRSRVLVAPRGMGTRPTSDRLRETLFNVLGPRLPGSHFADMYAGSGAVGIEALSRGAAHCLFIEQAPGAVAALRKNLSALGLAARATVDSRTVQRALGAVAQGAHRFDLLFLDPPYEAAAEYAATLRRIAQRHGEMLNPGALVVAEHARRDALEVRYGVLERKRLLEQGDAALSFYSLAHDEEVGSPASG